MDATRGRAMMRNMNELPPIEMPETLGVVRGEIHARQILQQGVERQQETSALVLTACIERFQRDRSGQIKGADTRPA